MTTDTKPVRATDSKRIDHETLLALLHYDPETGHFTWLQMARPNVSAMVGTRAGYTTTHGYRRIKVGGGNHAAHRLAWFYMTGEWPASEMDHANRDRDDNRWSNLRLATRSENMRNTRTYKNNSTGQRGVLQKGSRWTARIDIDKRAIWLGTFATFEEARDAYLKASAELYGEWAA
jgi:hypothetical protein